MLLLYSHIGNFITNSSLRLEPHSVFKSPTIESFPLKCRHGYFLPSYNWIKAVVRFSKLIGGQSFDWYHIMFKGKILFILWSTSKTPPVTRCGCCEAHKTQLSLVLSLSLSQDVVLLQSEPLRHGARGKCQRRPARHVLHAALPAHGSHGGLPLLPGVYQVWFAAFSANIVKRLFYLHLSSTGT